MGLTEKIWGTSVLPFEQNKYRLQLLAEPYTFVSMPIVRRWMLVLFSVMLLSCTTVIHTFPTKDADKTGVQSNRFRGTIFKSTYPEEKLLMYLGPRYKRITLTKEEVALAENILKQQIKSANSTRMNQLTKREYIHRNLHKYFRQYIGFIDDNGNKIVHINLHWDQFSIVVRLKGHWDSRLKYTSDFSIVFDGGSRYWRGNVDLNKKGL